MAKFEQQKNPRIGNEVRSEPTPQPTRTTTPVRNTAIPRSATPTGGARREITHEQIAKRAYEISISGSGGSELENWLRAERELKG
jgi:hypothetical protein